MFDEVVDYLVREYEVERSEALNATQAAYDAGDVSDTASVEEVAEQIYSANKYWR